MLLAIAHILVCMLLIRLFSLDRNEAFTVLLFGFFIDLDHIFGLAEYFSSNHAWSQFSIHGVMDSNIEWKSLMHQPIASVIFVPSVIFLSFALIILSWSIHLLMDFVQIYFLGVVSMPEIILTFTMAALIIYDYVGLWRLRGDESIGSRSFMRWELKRAKGEIKNWLPSKSRECQAARWHDSP